MNTKRLKILIVDDHRLFADGLAMLFSNLDGSPEIVTVSNPRLIINQLKPSSDYDLIVVDLYMPTLNGFAFLKSLVSRNIKIPTIVISSTDDMGEIEMVFECGASGFIPKDAPTHEMLDGVRQVLRGKRYLPDHLLANAALPEIHSKVESGSQPSPEKLVSHRQLEVLNLLHLGHSNSEIAMILGISESTAKGHVSALFQILKVKNRTACVRKAIECKLIKGH